MILSFALLFGAIRTTCAQEETVRYNSGGDLIWISNLPPDAAGWETRQTWTGKIVSVESLETETSVGFEFYLQSSEDKQLKMQASIFLDEGALVVDFENLMRKNRRIRDVALMCGSGGFWTAEGIRRL